MSNSNLWYIILQRLINNLKNRKTNIKTKLNLEKKKYTCKTMDQISDVHLTDYSPTIYTTPCTLHYKQNYKEKKWSIFAERNGVVIIVYNSTRNVLILVSQFRPAAYIQQVPKEERFQNINVSKYPASLGITLEFCGGLEDKNVASEKIAQEEIFEECGYKINITQLERIGTIKNLTETTGARSTFYYCEVTDDMKVNEGGGVEGENVEVVEMPVEEVIEYAQNPHYVSSPINFMYGLYWFLYNKYKKPIL